MPNKKDKIMAQVQIIQDTETFTQELVLKLESSLLSKLKKEFQPKQPEEYMTRQEVSKMLKVDISTVDNWGRTNKLIRHCIGNRIYFKRSEIEQRIISLK